MFPTRQVTKAPCRRGVPGGTVPYGMVRLFLVLDLGECGIHHGAFVLLGLLLATRCGTAGGGAFGLLLGIHLFTQFLGGGGQGFGLGGDDFLVTFAQHVLDILDGGFDGGLFSRIELVAVFGHRLLDHVHHAVGLVAGIGQFVDLLVVFGVQFGILDHGLDFGFGQAG